MAKFHEWIFENETVIVDGNEYVACEMRQCTVVYNGGEFPKMDQIDFNGCKFKVAGDGVGDQTNKDQWIKSLIQGVPNANLELYGALKETMDQYLLIRKSCGQIQAGPGDNRTEE